MYFFSLEHLLPPINIGQWVGAVRGTPTGLFLNTNWEVMSLLRFYAFLFFIQKIRVENRWGELPPVSLLHISELPVFIASSRFPFLPFHMFAKRREE